MTAMPDNSNRRGAPPPAGRVSQRAGNRARLVLAAVLGALAAACSVGLLATSAWLISRSAQRPPVLYLMAPAAVVQAFGLGRAVLRYAERLSGHDAALRLLAERRVRAYDALARLAPAGLSGYRSGDLLARLVADIDSLADRWLRVRLPYAAAAVAGAGAVAVVGAASPAAGLVLAPSRAAGPGPAARRAGRRHHGTA
jgi:ABC-type transport system involved in cytochrome bd biosynthesis fused ATPase/permease subunit